jgi:hypothetical protein
MVNSTQEIAEIIKVGTAAMLLAASFIVGMVLYLHNKMIKVNQRKF